MKFGRYEPWVWDSLRLDPTWLHLSMWVLQAKKKGQKWVAVGSGVFVVFFPFSPPTLLPFSYLRCPATATIILAGLAAATF